MRLFGCINGMKFTAERARAEEPWRIEQTSTPAISEGIAQQLVETAWQSIQKREMRA